MHPRGNTPPVTDQLPTPPKRTLSDAELAQRRAAAQKSTGPRTEEGKARSSRNGWKHGLTSAVHRAHFGAGLNSILGAMGKPCLRTCPIHPDNPNRTESACSLVLDGLTNAGGNCLDKTVYVQAFSAIIDAVESQAMEGMHALMATEIAATLQMLHDLRTTVARQGIVVAIPMVDADGNIVRDEEGNTIAGKFIANPGFPLILKTLEVLGISLPEVLATPQAQARAKVQEKQADAMQTAMGGIFARVAAARAGARPAIEHDEGDGEA